MAQQKNPRQSATSLKVKQLSAAGLTMPEICRQTGVSRQLAHFILRGYAREQERRKIRCRACGTGINPAVAYPRQDRKVLCASCAESRCGVSFGERLVAYRLAAGLQVEELAAQAGVHTPVVTGLEHGHVLRPQRKTVERLGRVLPRLANHVKAENSTFEDECAPNGFDRYKLLHGPYVPPVLCPGDVAWCTYRSREVYVTAWSEARISWPRCKLRGVKGGAGLLVDETLARAVRQESAIAIRYWWGVGEHAVTSWRRALGVEKLNNGSAHLRCALNQEIGRSLRGKKLPPHLVEKWRQVALATGRKAPRGWGLGRAWTDEEKELVGRLPDPELAARFNRSVNSVRLMRCRLGRPNVLDRRRRENRLATSRARPMKAAARTTKRP